MLIVCGHCQNAYRREDFRIQIPKVPVVDQRGVRQASATHKRCGKTTMIRETMARNLEAIVV